MKAGLLCVFFLFGLGITAAFAYETWKDHPNSGVCPGTMRKVPDVAMCGGRGPGAASHTKAAAPQAVRAACSGDAQRLCAGVPGKQRQACMKEHRAELSAGCKAAITQWRSN